MDQKIVQEGYYTSTLANAPSHRNNCYEIFFVKSGEVIMTCCDKTYTMKNNSMIFIDDLETHSIRTVSNNCEIYCVKLSPLLFKSVIKSNTLCSVFTMRTNTFKYVLDVSPIARKIEYMLKQIIEQPSDMPYSYEYEKSMIYLIFIELYRYDSSFFPSAPITNNNIVEKIQKQMETNYSYPYTLDRLAKENNMSKSYLSHLFKSVTGYGVIEYLLEYRGSIAKALLCDTNLSASQIALEVGFSSSSNFSRYIKKTTGLTPFQYRKTYSGKNISGSI